MMIKKINTINNVFSYSVFDWDNFNCHEFTDKNGVVKNFDGSFVKNNILFAENGSGKSNIIKLFKFLNGETLELKKHWDKSKEAQEIKITLDDSSILEFANNTYVINSLTDKFIFFDRHFIENYVHSIGLDESDTPKRRQQRGKNIVYLGNFIEFNKEIDRVNTIKNSLTIENEKLLDVETIKIESILNTINIKLSDVESKKDQIDLLKVEELENKIKEQKKDNDQLKKIENSLEDKERIKSLKLLSEIPNNISIPTDININDLFSFTVSKGIQQTLDKISHKNDFIKEGLNLITTQTTECPFCEQKIKNGDYLQIIKDYQGIFDKTFLDEEKKVKQLLDVYRRILDNLKGLSFLAENQSALAEVKQFLAIEEELPQIGLLIEEKTIINDELNFISIKETKLLDKVDSTKTKDVYEIIKKYFKVINNHNEIVKKINQQIEQLKKDVENGQLEQNQELLVELEKQLNEDIFFIKNKKLIKEYFSILEIYKKNNVTIDVFERIYQLQKNKIIEEFTDFVNNYFVLIKDFIKEISPSMEIFQIDGQATYDRRNIQEPAQCGFEIQHNGEDCSNELSEGEKQVIALAFFFAHLRKENNKDKIVVFDDPITNFDAGKRKSITELIYRETTSFNQLFVFTCDPLFREYCRKQFIDNRNFYYVFKTRGSSSVHYVPSNKETIYNSFETEFRDIDSIFGSDENIVIFGQKLRFCLETKIKEDYFGYSEDNFSNMIKTVTGRKKEDFEKLFINKEIILKIYSYCNTGGLAHYPRDGSTSWNELTDTIKQYLSLEL